MKDGQEHELESHLCAHPHGVDDPGHGAVGLGGAAVRKDVGDGCGVASGVVHRADHTYAEHSGKKAAG